MFSSPIVSALLLAQVVLPCSEEHSFSKLDVLCYSSAYVGNGAIIIIIVKKISGTIRMSILLMLL
jgi:hypothetical protein